MVLLHEPRPLVAGLDCLWRREGGMQGEGAKRRSLEEGALFLCEVACAYATWHGTALRAHDGTPPVCHYDVAGVYDAPRRADLRYCYGARYLGIDAPASCRSNKSATVPRMGMLAWFLKDDSICARRRGDCDTTLGARQRTHCARNGEAPGHMCFDVCSVKQRL